MNFEKFQLKWKIVKHFTRPKQRAALRKLFSLHQSPLKQNFLREIYRNIQTFAFKVLQESSSWASGNGAVQMIFVIPNRNIFVGKFVNWESFLAVFWEHVISCFKRVEICKMSEAFWAKLYCKMSDLSGWFLLALRFPAINSGIKKTDDVHRNVWTNAVRPKKYFQKRNYKYEILNHLYFKSLPVVKKMKKSIFWLSTFISYNGYRVCVWETESAIWFP